MTSTSHLRVSTTTNVRSPTTYYGNHLSSSQRCFRNPPNPPAGKYGPGIGKGMAIREHRHEPIHKHTSRRHKIARATGAVARMPFVPMALPFCCCGRADALAITMRFPQRALPVRRGPGNHPCESQTFCTSAWQRNPLPRVLPTGTPTKARVVRDRTVDVMRGRVVPPSRRAVRKVEEELARRAREAEAFT